MNSKKKNEARGRRQRRVRAKVKGSAARPRLSVYRALDHVYAQLIDDATGRTLASASDAEIKKADLKPSKGGSASGGEVVERSAKVAVAYLVGKKIAEKALAGGFDTVVFDRNGFAYTGRVSALADGAREGGLKF